MIRRLRKSWALNRRRSVRSWARCARWQRGQNAIASRPRKWLACEPFAEAAGRLDRPFGDFRCDAQPLAELAVDDEPEGRDERSSKRSGDRAVDIDVGHEIRTDHVPLRLEVADREHASADRAAKRTGVLPSGQHNDPSRLASEHLSKSAGAVPIAGQIV